MAPLSRPLASLASAALFLALALVSDAVEIDAGLMALAASEPPPTLPPYVMPTLPPLVLPGAPLSDSPEIAATMAASALAPEGAKGNSSSPLIQVLGQKGVTGNYGSVPTFGIAISVLFVVLAIVLLTSFTPKLPGVKAPPKGAARAAAATA
mmetsp:Transcript_161488/g.518542  ORF Transcript_161488/g.518542 Transcript_161488/m.518542 type:complete len:152 (+) Transcript_161488:108-563(+)